MSGDAVTDDLDKFIGWTGEVPRGWVQLPLDPSTDLETWARSWHARASAGVEWEEGEAGPEIAIAMLVRFGELVRRRLDPTTAAPLALALLPNVMDTVLAVVTAAAYPDSDEPSADRPDTVILGDVAAGRIDLPWGPTLRLRRIEPEGAAGTAEWIDTSLTERLSYLTTPDGLPGFTVVEAVWTDLVLGDAIAEYVDDLVAHLDLEFQQ